MQLTEALQQINDNNSSFIYKVYIPSLQKEVMFRSLSVGELKSLSKIMVEDDTENLLYATTTIISSLIQDSSINIMDLIELDRLAILFQLKKINMLGDDNYNVTCGKCEKQFLFEYDLNKVLEKIKNISLTNQTNDFEINHMKYTIEVGYPTLQDIMGYSEISKRFAQKIEEGKKTDEEKEKESFVSASFILKYIRLLYVRGLSINDNKIDNFLDSTLADRILLMEHMPAGFMNEVNNIIVKNRQIYDILDIIGTIVACPHCHADILVKVDPKDFFMI